MRISVFESKELQALLLALRGFDKNLKKNIRAATKREAQPIWQQEVRERAETKLEQRVLAQSARVQVSDQNVTLRAAHIGRPLSGGLDPKTQWPAVEFGADTKAKRTYTATSSRGKRYNVTRRTSAQLRPRRASGRVVFPAAASAIPRLAALWVQTAVRQLHDSLEGKN
jgi:hypothetical protein